MRSKIVHRSSDVKSSVDDSDEGVGDGKKEFDVVTDDDLERKTKKEIRS